MIKKPFVQIFYAKCAYSFKDGVCFINLDSHMNVCISRLFFILYKKNFNVCKDVLLSNGFATFNLCDIRCNLELQYKTHIICYQF